MVKPRLAALAAAVLALAAGPAFGAVHYQATTTTDGREGESVKGQRETVVRSETLVTELDIRAPAVDPARYQIPQGYTELQMLPEGQGPEGGPFGGLRQRDGGR